MNDYKEIADIYPNIDILFNEPLSKYTHTLTGGRPIY